MCECALWRQCRGNIFDWNPFFHLSSIKVSCSCLRLLNRRKNSRGNMHAWSSVKFAYACNCPSKGRCWRWHEFASCFVDRGACVSDYSLALQRMNCCNHAPDLARTPTTASRLNFYFCCCLGFPESGNSWACFALNLLLSCSAFLATCFMYP